MYQLKFQNIVHHCSPDIEEDIVIMYPLLAYNLLELRDRDARKVRIQRTNSVEYCS